MKAAVMIVIAALQLVPAASAWATTPDPEGAAVCFVSRVETPAGPAPDLSGATSSECAPGPRVDVVASVTAAGGHGEIAVLLAPYADLVGEDAARLAGMALESVERTQERYGIEPLLVVTEGGSGDGPEENESALAAADNATLRISFRVRWGVGCDAPSGHARLAWGTGARHLDSSVPTFALLCPLSSHDNDLALVADVTSRALSDASERLPEPLASQVRALALALRPSTLVAIAARVAPVDVVDGGIDIGGNLGILASRQSAACDADLDLAILGLGTGADASCEARISTAWSAPSIGFNVPPATGPPLPPAPPAERPPLAPVLRAIPIEQALPPRTTTLPPEVTPPIPEPSGLDIATRAQPLPFHPRDPLVILVIALAALAVLAAALYQRVARPLALAHPARAALHEACAAAAWPLTTGELAATCGLERKTAEYHLRYLVRLSLLREVHELGAVTRYAAIGAPRGAVPDPIRDGLLALVRRWPGVSIAEAARALSATRGRVEQRARELCRAGTLVSSRAEGERRLYLPEAPSAI